MTRLCYLRRSLLLGVIVWITLVPVANGQQTHTLSIRNGTIYVDGKQLASNQIPSDLDLEGVTAQYQFVGIQQPVIELNGRLFAVKDGLTPVSEEEVNGEESSVILQEIHAEQPAASARSAQNDRNSQENYLNEVQKANRELYEKLVQERRMESQAQDLARIIRMLPENSSERAAKIDSLHALLNQIFDLKQQNRRREIERLQREIEEVQRNLKKRTQLREQMIERRLSQLVGSGVNQ